MLAKILSAATLGLHATLIDVEVDIARNSLPSFTIVGLPDKAVEESKERVRSAIKNSGADFPVARIVVNLAPADLPKSGPVYDLPIAVGILIASGQIAPDILNCLFYGELSLDGNLRHANGILPVTYLAKQKQLNKIFIPHINEREACVVDGVKIYPIDNLTNLVRFFNEVNPIVPAHPIKIESILQNTPAEFDFADIIGQEQSKRALEIAAAGNHNIYLKGSPGSGKTMLARSFPGIMPRLSAEESLEVTKIYSITGNLPEGESLIVHRPFRSPHHTTSRVGLIGGGSNPMPGEISLSHRGVLFLDEFPEFPRNVLESLRQPMEDGFVSIARAKGSVKYPSKFLLIASANPCPCGYFGDPKRECTCGMYTIIRYNQKVSGPIMDRIDLHLNVPAVDIQKLTTNSVQESENSVEIRKRVESARQAQLKRFLGTEIRTNSEMSSKYVKKFCKLSDECERLMLTAASKLNLSARAYFKTIKVARTIADISTESEININHIAESLQYRHNPQIS